MAETIRIVLADDHPLMRAGIRATLVAEPDLTLVGEAADGHEAQRLSHELEPDVLLLDLNMPGPSAFETVAYLREHCPQVKVVMLTAYDDDTYVHGLVAAGVAGYVLKDEIEEAVVRAIRTVMQGDTWFSRTVVDKLARPATGEVPFTERPALTERELEVVRLVTQGFSNKEIGEALKVKERTVEFHVGNVLRKLGVASRVEAAVWAKEHGVAS